MKQKFGNSSDEVLWSSIKEALDRLEMNGDIIICTDNKSKVIEKIYKSIYNVIPKTNLSAIELSSIRSLIYHAISDEKFFDWEMPTLTGMTKEEFKKLLDKLPNI